MRGIDTIVASGAGGNSWCYGNCGGGLAGYNTCLGYAREE
jgi:hypothetical protein